MAFAHLQGILGTAAGGASTIQAILSAPPTTGNIVVVSISAFNATLRTCTVKDANNNNYTITTNSPSSAQNATAGACWHFYLLSAPANASATVNATFNNTNSGSAQMWVEEFTVTGGTAAFDTDIVGSSGASPNNVTTPTITPSAAGNLLWAGVAVANTVSAVGGTWSLAAGGFSGGNGAEYIASSASGGTAESFTGTAGNYDSIASSYKMAANIVPGWKSPVAGPSYAI